MGDICVLGWKRTGSYVATTLHELDHTFVNGRGQKRAAAIVPAEFVERYEAMIDSEDGRIALARLADLDAGHTKAVPADEAARTLGL